jgi:hypothetical protein
MKRVLLGVVFTAFAILLFSPGAFAQDHGEVGVFGELFHWGQGNTNLGGVGARLSINATHLFSLEAEMGYDFEQTFTENNSSSGGSSTNVGGNITAVTSNVRLLHGMFGPKFQTNRGPVRLFLTVKGGADDFMFGNAPVTFGTFTSSVSGLRSSNLDAVLYPGGGIEAFLGPVGLRLDVGDEIYFNNGNAYNNLRIAFGPSIRF